MNDSLHLIFTSQQLDYIFRMLGRCPADEVEALRASIRQQIAMTQKEEGPTAQAAGPLNGAEGTYPPPLSQ